MASPSIKVGTRATPLALAEAQAFVSALEQAYPKAKVVLVPIRSAADRIRTAAQMRLVPPGFFARDLEKALRKRKVNCAVCSAKDIAARQPEGLEVGAVLERGEAADAFVRSAETPLANLPPGSVIGAAGRRRQALFRAAFPRLEAEDLRGDLETCVGRLRGSKSRLAGILLSANALRRLAGESAPPHELVSKELLVPSPGQGALVVLIRAGDAGMRKLLAPVHHPLTAAAVAAEAALLRRMTPVGGIPLGIYGEATEEGLVRVIAAMAVPDGSRLVRAEATGEAENPESVAAALETLLDSRGAGEVLQSLQPAARRARPKANGRHRSRTRARRRSRAGR